MSIHDNVEQQLYFAKNEIHSKTEYIQEQQDIINRLERQCDNLRSECRALFNAKLQLSRELDHYKRAYYGCKKELEKWSKPPLPPPQFLDCRTIDEKKESNDK